MIRKLKARFIALSMVSLLALLALMVTGMNLLNYRLLVRRAAGILSVISEHSGAFPSTKENQPGTRTPNRLSPETPYEIRYFSVYLNPGQDTAKANTSHIAAVDEAEAIRLAHLVLSSGKEQGFIGEYRYVIRPVFSGKRVCFLDCGRNLASFRDSLGTSILIALVSYGVVFVIAVLMAGRIVRPIARNEEKQHRFITDAGHELKTPLTIISANVDLLETDVEPDNESIADIREQVRRLRSLTENLTLLSRTEETGDQLGKIEFPLSDRVAEIAQPFAPLFASQGKALQMQIQPGISYSGSEQAITQLVTLLLDNSLKYSADGGTTILTLDEHHRSVLLCVENPIVEPLPQEQLSRIFDRFYRMDASRNSSTGGHGIGLSVAKAIAEAHRGRISACIPGEKNFRITVELPRII